MLAVVSAFGQADTQLQEAIRIHQGGDARAAIPLYRDYLKTHPNSLDGLANYGAALAHEGLFGEAISQYESALKIQPGNPQVLLNLALSFYKTGRYADARERFQTALPLMAEFSPPHRQVAFLLADCDLRLGDYKAAISLLDPWEKQSPDDMALAYLLGTALIRDRQTDRGSAVIDKILRKGDSAEARLLLGTAKLNSMDFTGAREDLEKATQLNPRLPEAHASLGLAMLGLSQADAAAAAFKEELALDPNSFTATFQSGILAKDDRRFAEARVLLDRSLKLRPRDSAVRYQIALTEIGSGKLEEGRAELETIVHDEPRFTEAHVSLASVYYRLKRKEDGDRERALVRQLNAETQAKQPGTSK